MSYCQECGSGLVTKEHEEGILPFCPACQQFKFPTFSVAMSTMLLNQAENRLLLIQQGGRADYILTAGYVSQGESVEETVVREVQEELSLQVTEARFLRSRYYQPSNTLMLNFVAVVESEAYQVKVDEVDGACWFTFEEAQQAIRPNSLAADFLLAFLAEVQGDAHPS